MSSDKCFRHHSARSLTTCSQPVASKMLLCRHLPLADSCARFLLFAGHTSFQPSRIPFRHSQRAFTASMVVVVSSVEKALSRWRALRSRSEPFARKGPRAVGNAPKTSTSRRICRRVVSVSRARVVVDGGSAHGLSLLTNRTTMPTRCNR